jgi:hypothetical protein
MGSHPRADKDFFIGEYVDFGEEGAAEFRGEDMSCCDEEFFACRGEFGGTIFEEADDVFGDGRLAGF